MDYWPPERCAQYVPREQMILSAKSCHMPGASVGPQRFEQKCRPLPVLPVSPSRTLVRSGTLNWYSIGSCSSTPAKNKDLATEVRTWKGTRNGQF